jgi:hypothetical protein
MAGGWRPEWNGVRFFELGLEGTLNALRRFGVDVVDDGLGDYDCWESACLSMHPPNSRVWRATRLHIAAHFARAVSA